MEYKHSESFARLKSIQENIQGNPTSYQYLSTLDTLIYNSLFSVIDNTRFVDVYLAKILGWQASNPKRKASGVGRHNLVSYITLFMLNDKVDRKLNILKKMRLDRGILLEILRRWFKVTQEYVDLSNQLKPTRDLILKLSELETKVGLRPSHNLYGAVLQSKFWFDYATQFKTFLLEKYTRLCLTTAQKDYVQMGHKVDLEDIIQTYLMTASKAIDKCDTDKGVLTSHIQNWLLSAKNNVMANYVNGVAFQTPNHVKTQLNSIGQESISLDEIEGLNIASDTDTGARNEEVDRVRFIGKVFDPQGYARLVLGIQEILSDAERDKLRPYVLTSVNV